MLLALIFTLIAGLSTIVGTLFTYLKVKNIISYSLSFASGVMICVSITELIPESINFFTTNNTKQISFLLGTIYIVLGIFISIILDKFIKEENKLYKLGIFTTLAMIMHNILEGIITFLLTTENIALGISIMIAIGLHNIPEGISISIPIYKATNSRKLAFIYTFIAGIAEPIGGILAYYILKPIINDNMIGILLSVTAGIMIHISIFKLKFNNILFFTIGILFMIVAEYII